MATTSNVSIYLFFFNIIRDLWHHYNIFSNAAYLPWRKEQGALIALAFFPLALALFVLQYVFTHSIASHHIVTFPILICLPLFWPTFISSYLLLVVSFGICISVGYNALVLVKCLSICFLTLAHRSILVKVLENFPLFFKTFLNNRFILALLFTTSIPPGSHKPFRIASSPSCQSPVFIFLIFF